MAAAPAPKKVIGRYELGCEVAAGWLGPLWLVRTATDGEPGVPALARRVPLASPGEDDGMDRVSEAAWTAMELKHENIPNVLEVVVETDELAVITDHVEGVSLRTLQRAATSRRKPIAQPLALRIVADVLEAATSAQEQGLTLGDMAADLHGGLTPDSVLVGTDGRVRLADSLVSGAAARVRGLAHSPDRLAYAAPEALEGGLAGAPSDVFTAGVVLWELLSERRLFLGNSADAVTQKLRSLKIPRLDEVELRDRTRLPRELSDVVARALAREPDARFGSVAELLDALLATGCEVGQRTELAEFVEHVCEFELSRQRDALRPSHSSAGLGRRSASRLPVTRGETGGGATPSAAGRDARVQGGATPSASRDAQGQGVAAPPPLRALRLDSSASLAAQRPAPPVVAPSPQPLTDPRGSAPQMPRAMAAKTLLGLAPPKPAVRSRKTPPGVPAVAAADLPSEESSPVPTGSLPDPGASPSAAGAAAEPAPRPPAPSWVAHEAETEAILEKLAPVAPAVAPAPSLVEPARRDGAPPFERAGTPARAAVPIGPASPAAANALVPPPPPSLGLAPDKAVGAADSPAAASFDLGSALAETLQQVGATSGGSGAQDVSVHLASGFPGAGTPSASAVPLIHDRRLERPAATPPAAQPGVSRTLLLTVAVLASVAVLLGVTILVLLLRKPSGPGPVAEPPRARTEAATVRPSAAPEPAMALPSASSAPTQPAPAASSAVPEPPVAPDAGPSATPAPAATRAPSSGAPATPGPRATARPRPKPKPRFLPDDI